MKDEDEFIADEVNKRLGAATAPATPSAPATPAAPSNPANDYKAGDVVQFMGGSVYTSSTAITTSNTRDKSLCKVTQVAPKARNQYHLISEDGKGVYGWVVSEAIMATGQAVAPYTVRINKGTSYRKGAGTSFAVAGTINDSGIYTIVEEQNGFGKLKSGIGWVSLGSLQKV